MISICRTRTLRALRTSLSDAEAAASSARAEAAGHRQDVEVVTDSANRAEASAAELRAALARTTAEAARAEGELQALRAQALLDTEDRAALRMLLNITRKQSRAARVYVLFRRGELHSVHPTIEAAEAAAEAEGAPRSGWTNHTPGAAFPPAVEVDWRVQPLPLGGAR